MKKEYHSIRFKCNSTTSEILIAKLAGIGFESFSEDDHGFTASIHSNLFDVESFNDVLLQYNDKFNFTFKINIIAEKNWNEEWEKNFQPIVVDEYCRVRASFHKSIPKYPLEVIINPKMSFGTGHHDTTYLMISHIIESDITNKVVLDAGCGTCILSILTEKKGAAHVFGFDIDSWAYENALENIALNSCKSITVKKGDASVIADFPSYDLVLANINRNIILQDLCTYISNLKNEGEIILSGFLKEDEEIIFRKADQLNLAYLKRKHRNQWLSLVFKKKSK